MVWGRHDFGRRTAIFVWFAFAFWVPTSFAEEPKEGEEEHSPVKISHEDGIVTLTLSAETQEHIGLKTAELRASHMQPTVKAFGKLEQDPAGAFTLRAPVAGVLRAVEDLEWPGLGSELEAGKNLGYVEPRLTPLEVADVQSRWVDALAEIEEARADLDAAKASMEQKKRLNAEQGLVSDRSLEETQARVRNAEARMAAAQKRGDLYESLAKGQGQVRSLFPLGAEEDGEIVELGARPGEVVDAGQVILRTIRPHSLIARVALFAGDHVERAEDAPAQLSFPVLGDAVVSAKKIGLGAQAAATTGGEVLLYRIEDSGPTGLRAGMAFEANIPEQGEPLDGVLVPRPAIVRHAGLAYIYVETGEDHFERRACVLESPTPEGWFVREGLSPGDKIVVEGTQLLLSEELKSQIESEEAAQE